MVTLGHQQPTGLFSPTKALAETPTRLKWSCRWTIVKNSHPLPLPDAVVIELITAGRLV